jgi:hypothetical protein
MKIVINCYLLYLFVGLWQGLAMKVAELVLNLRFSCLQPQSAGIMSMCHQARLYFRFLKSAMKHEAW